MNDEQEQRWARLVVQLDPADHARLRVEARERRVSMGALVRSAVSVALDAMQEEVDRGKIEGRR